jgi:ELWxxDGT repeat protein
LEGRRLLSADVVVDVDPSSEGTNPAAPLYVPSLGSTVFWQGQQLWRTDGTRDGTIPFKSGIGSYNTPINNLSRLRSGFIFADGTGLWYSDGSAVGTVRLYEGGDQLSVWTDGNVAYAFQPVYRGSLSFELVKTDGTVTGTTVTDLRGQPFLQPDGSLGSAIVYDGDLLFMKFNAQARQEEVWRTDGTLEGTVRVTNISVPTSFTPTNSRELVVSGGVAYFKVYAGPDPIDPTTYDLYRTDGTEAGTVRLINMSRDAGDLVGFRDAVYFRNNGELWRSNGTPGGTVLLKDIAPEPGRSSHPLRLTATGGVFYFVASSAGNDVPDEVWRSDGTSGGTTRVTLMSAPISGIYPSFYGSAEDNVFFRATDHVWHTDGTDAGTIDLTPAGATSVEAFDVIEGQLLFKAVTPRFGAEFWWSDGTVAGTQVMDLSSTTRNSDPDGFAELGGEVYFGANLQTLPYNAPNSHPLWHTDGTAAGTATLGTPAAVSGPLVRVGNNLFFAATGSSETGQELYKSDGTVAGTVLVKDINAQPYTGSMPHDLIEVNGVLIFTATDATGTAPWRSDGTAAGTFRLPTDVPLPTFGTGLPRPSRAGGFVYFAAFDSMHGVELRKTDGATISLVKDISTGTGSSDPQPLGTLNGLLYFSATDPTLGSRRLWVTDATDAGTQMVSTTFAFLNSGRTSADIAGTTIYLAGPPDGSGHY